ncbi:MAG: oligosaccharide flippase family protein [Azospirillaceae bacterium]|nr:oligosaccharide flippase family protein [Azospirillaceae bacterium]
MVGWLRATFGNAFIENVTAFSLWQGVNYILPLIFVPFLARVLGPDGWGLVAIAQSFALYVTRLVEFGFDITAARDAARQRNDGAALARIAVNVVAAKLVLVIPTLVLAALAAAAVPEFRSHQRVFWSAILWGLGQAFGTVWFFQAIERLRWIMLAEILCRLLAAIVIVLVVGQAGDAWRYLALQGGAATVSDVIGVGLALRLIPPVRPSLAAIGATLRGGFQMFLFRVSEGLYSIATPFLLGLVASPLAVGYFAGAERIARAATRLIGPLGGAAFPHISHLVQHARSQAAAAGRSTLLVFIASGLAISAGLALCAPSLVTVLLGQRFRPAIVDLEILSLLPVVTAASQALGFQWMVPLGLDRAFVTIAFSSGVVYLVLAFVFASAFEDVGMAAALLATEFMVTAALYGVLRVRHLDPFSIR